MEIELSDSHDTRGTEKVIQSIFKEPLIQMMGRKYGLH